MFYGRYYHTLDEKGRVSLPKNFREQADRWIVTRGLDGGLFIVPSTQFATQLQEIEHLALTKKANRDVIRFFTNDALEVIPDRLGRIGIPEYLRAAAQLTKNLVVVGSLQRVEIWSVDRYHTYLDDIAAHAESLAEQVVTPTKNEQT
jgi:MraZ protein